MKNRSVSSNRDSKDSILRAFNADQVARLTGLSHRQLRAWDKEGFFSPEYAFENRRSPYSRLYSFRDIVGLRTLSVLRNEYDVPMQRLKRAADKLSSYSSTMWSDLVLYVFNRDVYFKEPDTGKIRGASNNQYVADLPLRSVIDDMTEKAEKLRSRPKQTRGRITRHRNTARNSWIIAGTRISTAAIRRFAEAGYSIDEIMREYPTLSKADVQAALDHEKRLAKSA